nr:hypothetical protein Iba_scaffold18202CG0060 [Ipomoea batatas]
MVHLNTIIRNHPCKTHQALLMVHMLKIISLILVLHSRDILLLPLISLLLLPPISPLLLPISPILLPISLLHSRMSNNLAYFFPHQFLMFPRLNFVYFSHLCREILLHHLVPVSLL